MLIQLITRMELDEIKFIMTSFTIRKLYRNDNPMREQEK